MSKKFGEIFGVSDFKSRIGIRNLVRSVAAEFFGTFFIVFFGCGCAINLGTQEVDLVRVSGEISPNLVTLWTVRYLILQSDFSLGFGLGALIGISACGPVSGGHLNPAVSVGLVVTRRCSVLRGILFIAGQCVGAIESHTSASNATLEGEKVHHVEDVTPVQGLVVELVTTAALVLIVLAVTDPDKDNHCCAPLSIGLTIAVCHLLAIPYTGCGLNPARSLGPALVTSHWKDHWIYWAGPFAGSLVAALMYKVALVVDRSKVYDIEENEVDGFKLASKRNN